MPYRVINIYYSVTCYTNHINSTRIQSIASIALMVFPDVSDVCVVYINDLMIFMSTDNQEDHDRIVLEVLKQLCDNDLFVKPEKCHF